MQGKLYSNEHKECSCNSSYPIIADNLDLYNSMHNVIVCYYNSSKIFIDNGRYPVKGDLIVILLVSSMLFMVLLVILIFKIRKYRNIQYRVVIST